MTSFKLKRDKFQSIRGESHLLDISCMKCGAVVIKYQKDGKGKLFRCYLNRIFHPPEYAEVQRNSAIKNPQEMPHLTCLVCKTVIGFPMRYDDGRLAFRLRKGFYLRKIG